MPDIIVDQQQQQGQQVLGEETTRKATSGADEGAQVSQVTTRVLTDEKGHSIKIRIASPPPQRQSQLMKLHQQRQQQAEQPNWITFDEDLNVLSRPGESSDTTTATTTTTTTANSNNNNNGRDERDVSAFEPTDDKPAQSTGAPSHCKSTTPKSARKSMRRRHSVQVNAVSRQQERQDNKSTSDDGRESSRDDLYVCVWLL